MTGPLLAWLLLVAPLQASGEVIAQIQVHGNTVTPEHEVLAIAAVAAGSPLDPATIGAIEQRLRDSGRFEAVEVRKRFASIADPSQILLVIVVDEGRVGIDWNRAPGEPARAVRRRGPPFMFAPILGSEDGYGLTYGARLAFPGIAGAQSRVGLPLTWGGEKRAAVELEKQFDAGPFTRVLAGAALTRRTSPHYDAEDIRRRVWVRAERALVGRLRVGSTLTRERAELLDASDTFTSIAADATLDTRLDPFLARNAIYARAQVERVGLAASPLVRREVEVQGHLALVRQAVLVVRALREDANGPQPLYLKPLLGGMRNLRGFRAGFAAGDTLVAASAELRLPLTSPLNVGKLGVSAFVDAGTVYDHGARLADQRVARGIGGSTWISLPMARVELSVARGLRHSTRVHVGASVTF